MFFFKYDIETQIKYMRYKRQVKSQNNFLSFIFYLIVERNSIGPKYGNSSFILKFAGTNNFALKCDLYSTMRINQKKNDITFNFTSVIFYSIHTLD